MPSSAAARSTSPRTTTIRSLEAHTLPQVIDVRTDAPCVVLDHLVAEGAVVTTSDHLAAVRSPSHPWEAVAEAATEAILIAPAAGLIVRRWAEAGDAVRAGGRVVSIACRDDLLVVARFGGAAAELLRRKREGWVRFVGAPAGVPAAIVSVAEVPVDCRWYDGENLEVGPVRVLLSVTGAPDAALWPGAQAVVEISSP